MRIHAEIASKVAEKLRHFALATALNQSNTDYCGRNLYLYAMLY